LAKRKKGHKWNGEEDRGLQSVKKAIRKKGGPAIKARKGKNSTGATSFEKNHGLGQGGGGRIRAEREI